MKLIANVISNNEIVYLKYLMKALDRCCDEIIVVNNDDNAETKKIVEENNGKFLVFKMNQNVSEKRNVALNASEDGAWILRIDTDEIPTFSFINHIRHDLLEAEIHKVDRLMVELYHLTDFFKCKREMGVELRIFKKNKTCRYEGWTHEIIAADVFEGRCAELPTGDALIHFRYMDPSKIENNVNDIKNGYFAYSSEDLKKRLEMDEIELPAHLTYPVGKDLYNYLSENKGRVKDVASEFLAGVN